MAWITVNNPESGAEQVWVPDGADTATYLNGGGAGNILDKYAGARQVGTNAWVAPDGTRLIGAPGGAGGFVSRADVGDQYFDSVYGREPSKSGFLGQSGSDWAGMAAMLAAAYGGGALAGMGGAAAGASSGIAAADLGAGMLPEAMGGYAAGGGAAGATAATNSGGGGMWDWLDSFSGGPSLDPTGISSNEMGLYGLDGGIGGVGGSGYTQAEWDAMMQQGAGELSGGSVGLSNPGGLYAGSTGVANSIVPSSLPSWLSNAPSALKSLFTSTAPIPGGRTAGGGILGAITGDPLGAAFNMTPFLLALAQSQSQAGDLNGVLNSINGQGYTDSILHPYDLETGVNRTNLLNDQELRGVRGSSFGDQSIGNFDYTRALGRGDLASKAGLASAGLAGNLINTRNTNTNMLLGAGLNASAGLFKPQQDPFNLRALMGF